MEKDASQALAAGAIRAGLAGTMAAVTAAVQRSFPQVNGDPQLNASMETAAKAAGDVLGRGGSVQAMVTAAGATLVAQTATALAQSVSKSVDADAAEGEVAGAGEGGAVVGATHPLTETKAVQAALAAGSAMVASNAAGLVVAGAAAVAPVVLGTAVVGGIGWAVHRALRDRFWKGPDQAAANLVEAAPASSRECLPPPETSRS